MSTTSLIYIGIHDEVQIPALNDLIAVRGVPVAVPDEAVGRAPKGDPDSADYDPGEGLLAQVDNWAKPGTKAAKAAPAANDTPLTDQLAEQATHDAPTGE